MTCLFPDPLPRMKRIVSNLSPSGTIQVAVLETECRKEHIDMIDTTHPLLSVSIDCLALEMGQRPNAHELCRRIVYFPSKGPGTDSFNDVEEEKLILSLRKRL